MRKFLNAGHFRSKFASLRADYENVYSQQINRVRALASNNPADQVPPAVDECLEYHARTYIINGMFEALNWPLQSDDGLPAFIPEAPIESLERGTTRFLDYFGFSPITQKPLIVIEAKRPNITLPSYENLPEVIASGLRGENLGEVWNKILTTMMDYVKSIADSFGHSPQIVGITNGSWLILFLSPKQTFINRNFSPDGIVVFIDSDDIYTRAAEVWEYLEYTKVAGGIEARSCDISELPFRLEPTKIKKITLGLKLIYSQVPTQFIPRPHINILPIVLVESQDDIWLYIQRKNHSGFDLPHSYKYLQNHIQEINDYTTNLVTEISHSLGIEIRLSPIYSHYEQDLSIFNELRGVNNITNGTNGQTEKYIIVTGSEPHFLRELPSIIDCRYHKWEIAYNEGVAAFDGPIMMPRIFRPKSFFLDEQAHHCAHAAVYYAKTSELNPENRQRCGLRSNDNGFGFCEISQIEEFLCCRTCVYECVCTRSEIFNLPCILQ